MKKGTQIIIDKTKYELIETIGNGGSGVVWRVTSNKNEYAIKIINSNKTAKIARFKNEIEFCKTGNHKNIIKVIADGKLDGKPCYVMPLYSQTLKDLIVKEKNASKLIGYILKLCNGLQYIHKKGIIHRDIKPENILVEDNHLVLADFGIAHFKDFRLTKKGDLLANRNYIAPEQKEKSNADSITKAADIFALGLIINECFTKQNPAGSYFKLIADSYPLYADLDSLVANMIRQNPKDRPSIDSVIMEMEFIHNNIKLNIEGIATDIRKKTQLPGIEKSILNTIIQRASEDILLGKILFNSKSVKELDKYNHSWHMKIGYMVDDFLFNLYVQERIHNICKGKFKSESIRYGSNSWRKTLDLENNEEHKLLYKKINNILSNYKLQNEGESLFNLSGEILKYFSACIDYHCQEILEKVKQVENFAEKNLKDAPIISIVQTLKGGIIQNIELLLNGIDEIGGQYEFKFEEHISINPGRTSSYIYNDDSTELLESHHQKREIQIQEILSNFQKKWKITYNQIDEEEFSIKFKTYNQFEKFRKFALDLSKPHYFFEGDVIDIVNKPNFIGNMVELKLNTVFEIPDTIAKIIGQTEIIKKV